MTYSEIDMAYAALFLRFRAAVDSSPYSARFSPGRGFGCRTTGPGRVLVTSLVYMPGWSYRSGAAKKKKGRKRKKIDILLQGADEFDCGRREIVKSSVQVLYLRNGGSTAVPLLSLHYDFELPAQPAHPLFHVQLGQVRIEGDLGDLGFRKTIDDAGAQWYSGARIPTPHIGICSALLGLAADHLPHDAYNEFLVGVRGCQAVAWEASCQQLKTSLAGGGFLHSHHWYEPAPTS